jgi:hypothetical protein
MKFFAKFVLAASVAVVAIAVSAAPSEAARKKGMAPGVHHGQLCTVPGKAPNTGTVMSWGYNNQWYPTALTSTCYQPFCPMACK